MELINAALRSLFDAFLGMLSSLPDWVALGVLALLLTVLILPIIKWTFNLAMADRFKDKVYAGLFEIRLFNDRLGATFRGLFDVLRYTGGYMGAWLLPLVIMTVPMLPIFAHLHFHYGYEGLDVGETTLLKAEFSADRDGGKPPATLIAPDGVEVLTPALWVPAHRELTWKIVGTKEGIYDLQVKIDGAQHSKSIVVSEVPTRRSPHKPKTSFVDQLIYPAEAPLAPNSGLEKITVDYREGSSFVMVPTWCWILILLSIPFFLILKKPFGVEI